MPWDGESYADAFIDYLAEGDGQLGASPGDTLRRLRRDSMNEEREQSIGALWSSTTRNGDEYFKGQIELDGAKVSIIVFRNKRKSLEKHPDYQIFKSVPRGER